MSIDGFNPAFAAGAAARKNGIARDINPHPPESEDFNTWLRGYDFEDEMIKADTDDSPQN